MNDEATSAPHVAGLVESIVGATLPVRIEAYDGSACGDIDASTRVEIRSPDALVRVLQAPNELGLARAYAAGDIEIDGDIRQLFVLSSVVPDFQLDLPWLRDAARLVGTRALRRIPPPPEEARPHGRLHSLRRDKAVISHHYDISNTFYGLFLDESMTYSCAVFEHPSWNLEQAQAAKHELALRKLALRPGMRVLDIGCGWGAHALHAARHFGVTVVGVTLAVEQAELARKRIAETGLSGQIDIRVQDYRTIDDGPFDAISSIGMFEHVGWNRTDEYFADAHDLLAPGGRFLLHSITKPDARRPSRRSRAQFIYRYIFPDGELQPLGRIVDRAQMNGFDLIDVEALNPHYGTTLDHWLDRLEANWDAAVVEVGLNRARIWRLYLAGCAAMFHGRKIQIHQMTLGRPAVGGGSAVPRRPDWERAGLDRPGGAEPGSRLG